MSTFLNRFNWDSDTRLIVVEALSADPVYHDGLVYDVVDQALLVDYSTSPTFFQAGIGFTTTGAMCVFDASAGLPSDVRWQSGLPIKEAGSRLCVDPTNAVSYYHQGVTFTTVGAVAVTGTTPPVTQTFDNVVFHLPGGEPSFAYIGQLYFGTSGSVSGLYTVQATFLADHPGLTLQDFSGYAPPGGGAAVPASFPGGFTATIVNADTGALPPAGQAILDSAIIPSAWCVLAWAYLANGTTVATLTFSPAVNSVGFNYLAFLQSGVTVDFRSGVTTLASQSVTGSSGFLGYSSATGVVTSAYQQESNTDHYQQESNSDIYIRE